VEPPLANELEQPEKAVAATMPAHNTKQRGRENIARTKDASSSPRKWVKNSHRKKNSSEASGAPELLHETIGLPV